MAINDFSSYSITSTLTSSRASTTLLPDEKAVRDYVVGKSIGTVDASIASTITWIAEAAPASANGRLRYSWRQDGSWCKAQFRLSYGNAATSATAVFIDLPADMPKPADFTGQLDNEALYSGDGQAYTSNLKGNGSAGKVALCVSSSASSGYFLTLKGLTAGAMVGAVMSIEYPVTSNAVL